jgi:hypothetical protein
MAAVPNNLGADCFQENIPTSTPFLGDRSQERGAPWQIFLGRTGMYLIAMHLMGVPLMGRASHGVHLVGVHLISVHVIGYQLHRRQH